MNVSITFTLTNSFGKMRPGRFNICWSEHLRNYDLEI